MSINNSKERRSKTDQLSAQCFDNASTPMFAIDENHIVIHWNKALVDASGLASKAMIGTRDQWKPFYATSRPCLADLVVDGASLEEIEKLYPPNNKLLLANGLSIQAEDFFSDMGSGQWLQFAVTPIKNRRGRTIGAVETFVDISARIQAEKFLLQSSETNTRSLIQTNEDAWVLISDNLIDDCNQGALELFGCADITSLISLSFLDLSPNKQFNGQRSKQEIERHNKMTLENGSCCFDWLSKRLDTGQTFFLEVTQTLLTLGKTQITQLSFRDMTERKAIEAKIAKHIYEDELTQLPNRLALTQRLQHVLAVYNRTHYRGALLFLDVQNFNSINNRYGYKTGDKLLITIANRLQTSVRKGDTVSRFGGDKFVIMFEDLNPDEFKAAQQVEAASRKILIDLEKPYQLNEKPLSISASIGIAMFSHDSRPAQLFQQSDTAMHRARNKQQNGVRFFDTAIQKTIDGRSEIITYLQEALVETAFELHYQLQVDAKGQPLGAEALLRLKHSTQGYIPPNEYLPIAEESGMIAPIGRWVLETACRQLKRWQESPATSKLTLTINVSPVEFLEENFIEHIQNTIKLNNIKHERLKIELTESMLTDISDEIIEKIIPLSNLGVQFSLDGFGKSHSSMHHLSKLPLNELKIDQSIISTLEDDPLNSRLVRAITIMTKELKIDVIAKGVEKKKQQQMLIKFGCFNYQGFLYAKPLSIDEFEALLETKKTLNT